VTGFGVLSKQQTAHQKAAQREKQVHAFAPEILQWVFNDLDQIIAGMNSMKVIAHHRDNRNAANEVKLDRPPGHLFYGSWPAK
jgi:hypothetical protein